MATIEELEDAFTIITRKAPSAAQGLILQDLAARTQNGVISDEAAHKYIFGQAAGTTAVAALTYQFFTGKIPTEAGFDFLVNSDTNANDLNDAYYQGFNTENRYINFAVNLGVAGEGKTVFSQAYGSLTFAETVAVAYSRIIGSAQAEAAGIKVADAVADIAGRKPYFDDLVRAQPAADRDLAAKAAVVGYILAEAVKSGIGAYASGLTALYKDMFDDEVFSFNVDLEGYINIAGPPGNTFTLQQDQSYAVGPVAAGGFTDRADTTDGDIDAAAADVSVEMGNGGDFFGGKISAAGAHTLSLDMGGGIDIAAISAFTEGGKSIHLDGGDGRDNANITLGSDITSAVTTIEGFETVSLRTTGGVNRAVDYEAFDGVTKLSLSASNGTLEVTNLTDDVAIEVRSTGNWDTVLTYDDVDAAEITLGTSNTAEVIVEEVETLTVNLKQAVTTQSIFALDTSTLVVKGEFSANFGIIVLGGDERLADLSAIKAKDVAFEYRLEADDIDTVLLGGGDDALLLVVGDSQGDAVITLGAGDDTVEFNNWTGGSNISFAATGGALKTVTRVTDFDLDDDSVIVTDGAYLAMAPGAFIGGAGATDQARFAAAGAALNQGFVADRFTVFDAADSSGVYIYSSGDNAGEADDVYIKLVGISLDDLDIDGDTITG